MRSRVSQRISRRRKGLSDKASREADLQDEIQWLRSLLNRDEEQDYEEPDSWQAKYWQ
jgi:hypothetical protein